MSRSQSEREAIPQAWVVNLAKQVEPRLVSTERTVAIIAIAFLSALALGLSIAVRLQGLS